MGVVLLFFGEPVIIDCNTDIVKFNSLSYWYFCIQIFFCSGTQLIYLSTTWLLEHLFQTFLVGTTAAEAKHFWSTLWMMRLSTVTSGNRHYSQHTWALEIVSFNSSCIVLFLFLRSFLTYIKWSRLSWKLEGSPLKISEFFSVQLISYSALWSTATLPSVSSLLHILTQRDLLGLWAFPFSLFFA